MRKKNTRCLNYREFRISEVRITEVSLYFHHDEMKCSSVEFSEPSYSWILKFEFWPKEQLSCGGSLYFSIIPPAKYTLKYAANIQKHPAISRYAACYSSFGISLHVALSTSEASYPSLSP
jgi:hypothetical protein